MPTQSYLTLQPIGCSPLGSSVHGILLARNIGVSCHFLLQGIFPTPGSNMHLLHCQALTTGPPGLPILPTGAGLFYALKHSSHSYFITCIMIVLISELFSDSFLLPDNVCCVWSMVSSFSVSSLYNLGGGGGHLRKKYLWLISKRTFVCSCCVP